MPLLGNAAMLLSFDVAAEGVAEHDDWHTHEHLPERMSIPGFLRGTRWTAVEGGPRYCVLYEVAELAVLKSEAYLARLNNPSPWTSRMMPLYRGMTRGLCTVVHSHGHGAGTSGLLLRFGAANEARLRGWLGGEALRALPMRRGLAGVHVFQGALAAPMTNEQRIRGADAGVEWAVLATGYDKDAVAALAQGELGAAALESRGASRVASGLYRAAMSLSAQELARG
jgi:hypothetical protein